MTFQVGALDRCGGKMDVADCYNILHYTDLSGWMSWHKYSSCLCCVRIGAESWHKCNAKVFFLLCLYTRVRWCDDSSKRINDPLFLIKNCPVCFGAYFCVFLKYKVWFPPYNLCLHILKCSICYESSSFLHIVYFRDDWRLSAVKLSFWIAVQLFVIKVCTFLENLRKHKKSFKKV